MLRVLDDFEGRWRIQRHILPNSGARGLFEGEAEWRPSKGGLAYIETGTLTLSGAVPMQAERRYHWASDLSVYFQDGRFFHTVPAGGGETRHWCDPDLYTVNYDFTDWPGFTVRWHVRGPRKAYTMCSSLMPLEAP